MRRLLFWLAALGCLAALLWVGWLVTQTVPSPQPLAVPTVKPLAGPAPKTADAPKKRPFDNLPVDVARPVQFRMDDDTRSRLTPRERRDQLLDWLLYTVVGDSGVTPDEFNRVLFDLPALRHGHLHPVANFEFGPSRTAALTASAAVVLVPAGDDAVRRDLLAHAADEHRKTLGRVPATFHVFEYTLDEPRLLGGLTRRPDLSGETLFSEAYGYSETVATDAAGLGRFLSEYPDLVSAERVAGNKVRLGGRKTFARKYRGFRAEDVATVWKAHRNNQNRIQAFEADCKRELEKLANDWENGIRPNPVGRPPAFDDDPLEAIRRLQGLRDPFGRQRDLDVAGFKKAAEELVEKQRARARELRFVDHTGFSLDPVQDFDQLLEWFDKTGKGVLELFGQARDVPSIRAGLVARDITPLLKWIAAQKEDSITRDAFDKAVESHRYQRARYDGDLQGTEVGMVLFYTDLLAKLWTLDYQGSHPSRAIEDFRSDLHGGNPALYEAQTRKYGSTRLWFGPEDRGYNLTTGRDGMVFARRAARLFSLSSDRLDPGKEVPTNYASDRVMTWWNDHFEEVAAHEPEYERLNQYIKWSLVVSWLENAKALDTLGFLSYQAVDHSAWFGDWVQKHPELRFQKWETVGLHPRGFKGEKTEAMKILSSASFADYGISWPRWTVRGGVSGARPRELETRPTLPLPTATGTPVLRGVNFKESNVDRNTVTTVGGARHTFAGGESARQVSTPRQGQELRGPHGQVTATEYRRTVERQGEVLKVETQADSLPVASLRIEPTRNGFEVGSGSRDLDSQQAVLREASGTGDPASALRRDPRVEALFVGENGELVVKLRDSESWMRVRVETEKETAATASVPGGWRGRVGDSKPGSKTLLHAALTAEEVTKLALSGETVRIEPSVADRRDAIPVLARGPPAASVEGRPTTVHYEGKTLAVLVQPDGSVVVRTADLPAELRAPEALARLLTPVLAARRDREMPEAVEGGLTWRPGQVPLMTAMRAGEFQRVAEQLAADPAAREALRLDRERWEEEILRCLDAGLPGKALERIRAAEQMHGEMWSRLSVLRGLAQARLGRDEASARDLNLPRADQPVAQFLNEVRARLAEAKTPAERAEVLRTARARVLRDMKDKGKTAADGRLTLLDGKLALEVELASNVPTRTVDPKDLPAGARLLLDDDAGLNNLDWSPGQRNRTLGQAVEGGELELVELYGGKAKADPALQAIPDRVKVGEKTYSDPLAWSHVRAGRIRYHASIWPPDEEEVVYEEEDDPDRPGEKRTVRVFVLRKKVKRTR